MTGQGWSLRRRVNRAIVGVLLLLMVLIATVIYFINDAKRTGDELVEQWDPAYTISQNTLTAMVNQETGVRGYALGQDDAFLEPYNIAELLRRPRRTSPRATTCTPRPTSPSRPTSTSSPTWSGRSTTSSETSRSCRSSARRPRGESAPSYGAPYP